MSITLFMTNTNTIRHVVGFLTSGNGYIVAGINNERGRLLNELVANYECIFTKGKVVF